MEKKELYGIVKVCSPFKMPEIDKTDFRQYSGTCWLDYCVEDKICKIVYEELFAGESTMWIRLVDFFNDKVLYDKVIHPERILSLGECKQLEQRVLA